MTYVVTRLTSAGDPSLDLGTHNIFVIYCLKKKKKPECSFLSLVLKKSHASVLKWLYFTNIVLDLVILFPLT